MLNSKRGIAGALKDGVTHRHSELDTPRLQDPQTAILTAHLDQGIQLFIATNGKLQVAGGDTLHLQVLGGVTCQLQHLGSQVLCVSACVHGK